MKNSIINHLWLWCHPTGCYNNQWNLPGESDFSPVNAAAHLGIKTQAWLFIVIKLSLRLTITSCSFQGWIKLYGQLLEMVQASVTTQIVTLDMYRINFNTVLICFEKVKKLND